MRSPAQYWCRFIPLEKVATVWLATIGYSTISRHGHTFSQMLFPSIPRFFQRQTKLSRARQSGVKCKTLRYQPSLAFASMGFEKRSNPSMVMRPRWVQSIQKDTNRLVLPAPLGPGYQKTPPVNLKVSPLHRIDLGVAFPKIF